ncbi:hypothetical protein JAAARDRAFT_93637, partial [Jaapia argillacea MUCL 33604]
TRWMAPELHHSPLGTYQTCQETDIYAFGCTCYEVFTRHPPFFNILQDVSVASEVVKGCRPSQPSTVDCHGLCLEDDMWRLIVTCWSQEQCDR